MKKVFGRATFGSLVLPPFLLTMYVVLAPLAANIGIVGLQAIRSLGVALLCVEVLLPLVRVIVGDRVKAALLVSGAILLVSSYGHRVFQEACEAIGGCSTISTPPPALA